MKYYVTAVVVLTTTACTPGKLRVTSTPAGGTVSVASPTGGMKTLGTTPLEVSLDEAFVAEAQSTRIIIEKAGMRRESVLLTRSALSSNQRISVGLSALSEDEIKAIVDKNCSGDGPQAATSARSGALARLALGVAQVQSLIAGRRYGEAKSQLANLIFDYPGIPVLYTLMGNTRYLLKDTRGAFESYKQAERLDPNNLETRNMVKKLQSIVAPIQASEGG